MNCQGCNKEMTQKDLLQHNNLYRKVYCKQCNLDFPDNTKISSSYPSPKSSTKYTLSDALQTVSVIMILVGLVWALIMIFVTPPLAPIGVKISNTIIPLTVFIGGYMMLKATADKKQ